MSNCRKYGQYKRYIPNKRRALRHIKTKTRNRERTMPDLVAVHGKEPETDAQKSKK